ncbi:MAG: dipeptide epimerase [Planctomycetaceae bacterium]|nr:dipeptide epimerase [Planctomycetaceae bacterium]
MKLLLHQFELPLRHVFTISRESISVQKTLIVELRQDGKCGFGEATTNAYYNATIPRMTEQLSRLQLQIERHSATEPEQLWDLLSPQLADNPFALCAVDQAANDLAGKLQGAPLYKLWGYDFDQVPVSNFTIGIDAVEVMVEKLKETPNWPIYKIKLGTSEDLEIVEELRRHTDARFRVDANCGWTVAETITNSHRLLELGVEFIEQPLGADDWNGHRQVYSDSVLPIIADESCIRPEDVARCADRFHGVNIKLVKCGGLTPARRMIREAKQRGLKAMVGCMTESTVGISAIAQLLPLLDYVDMDGAALLSSDIATGATVVDGHCQTGAGNGTGAQLVHENVIWPL